MNLITILLDYVPMILLYTIVGFLAYKVCKLKNMYIIKTIRMPVICFDCGREYGDEYGFPDLIIDNEAWKTISPTHDEGGLLCPSCICKRLYDAGIECKGVFTSGPFVN